MPDVLYQRYLDALSANRDHRAVCTTCTNVNRCREGQRLRDAITRSRSAHLARQKQQR